MVSCTEEDVTIEFLDYGNEAVLYDSQKVAERQFKWTLTKIPQLRKLPEEWEKFPAMAVEVELGLETSTDEDYLAFLMDEAVQTFNQKEERYWVCMMETRSNIVFSFSAGGSVCNYRPWGSEWPSCGSWRVPYLSRTCQGRNYQDVLMLIREISALHICSSVT